MAAETDVDSRTRSSLRHRTDQSRFQVCMQPKEMSYNSVHVQYISVTRTVPSHHSALLIVEVMPMSVRDRSSYRVRELVLGLLY